MGLISPLNKGGYGKAEGGSMFERTKYPFYEIIGFNKNLEIYANWIYRVTINPIIP